MSKKKQRLPPATFANAPSHRRLRLWLDEERVRAALAGNGRRHRRFDLALLALGAGDVAGCLSRLPGGSFRVAAECLAAPHIITQQKHRNGSAS